MTESAQPQVTDNEARSRFELDVEHSVAFIDYRRRGATLVLTHAEVPAALRGRGHGERLARGVLQLLSARGEKVVPQCSFIAVYIERHPEFRSLLA